MTADELRARTARGYRSLITEGELDAIADLIDAVDVTWGYARLVGVNRSDWVVRADDMAAMRDALERLAGEA